MLETRQGRAEQGGPEEPSGIAASTRCAGAIEMRTALSSESMLSWDRSDSVGRRL